MPYWQEESHYIKDKTALERYPSVEKRSLRYLERQKKKLRKGLELAVGLGLAE